MTAVLLLCLALLASSFIWSAHRHRQIVAWNRELDSAFGGADRREVPRHRVL